jgi:hypothetical protein
MIQDDLTQVKHIGASRMKTLYDAGITTVQQLHTMPLAELAEIKSINIHYARLIKTSVAEYLREKAVSTPDPDKPASKKKAQLLHREYQKKVRKLRKHLNRVNEDLKPLWEKKYLGPYVDLKKQITKLKARLRALSRIKDSLTKKEKKKIIKHLEALNQHLKKVDKKTKKKHYKHSTQEIRAFSKMLKKILA